MFLNSAGMFDIAKFKEFSNQILHSTIFEREEDAELNANIKSIIR
jgi:hypothetical protein